MSPEEIREAQFWFTKHIIKQWVADGATLEEAKQLWREMDYQA